MQQKDLRTYQRRGVTRESGYHTCEETTGGECIIAHAFQFNCRDRETVFTFKRSTLDVVSCLKTELLLLLLVVIFGQSKKQRCDLNWTILMRDRVTPSAKAAM